MRAESYNLENLKGAELNMSQKLKAGWIETLAIGRQTFLTLYAFGALVGWIVIVSKASEVYAVITK